MKNGGLDTWINQEVARWCVENPIDSEEPIDDYITRAIEGSKVKSREAMDFGTKLHDAIESRVKTGKWENIPAECYPWIEPAEEYISTRIESFEEVELSLTCVPYGYGGKIDAEARHEEYGGCILDWKTQGVKTVTPKIKEPYKRPAFWESWIRQLALYSAMVFLRDIGEAWAASTRDYPEQYISLMPKCLSVVIDSGEPSPFYEKLWTEEEQLWGLESGLANVRAFHIAKKYTPEGCIL